MADGENILLNPGANGSELDEPLAKKRKIGATVGPGVKSVQAEPESRLSETGKSWAAAAVSPRPVEEEKTEEEEEAAAATAAAAGQATVTAGGDNGLSVPEPRGELPNHGETASIDGPVAELNNSVFVDDSEAGHPNGFSFHDSVTEDDDRSSHASSSDWTPQPQIGSYSFIQQHIMRETDPRTILRDLLPETVLPPDLDDMTLWQIIINISEPPKRKKRKDINTLEDVVRLLHESKKILVLTGAGEIYPGQFQPSPCHRFISMLDKQGKLLRNYTQNIDTLEQVAGVQRIIQCHGSFATASCLVCKHKVDCEAIREDIFSQVVPHCPKCPDFPLAIMKPDIVFFGENLPEQFHRAMKQDKDEVDLLIVIGSSLKVRPVALIPSSIPHEVPQILINREQLPHLNFDVELLGDCDVIINELCHRLGGEYKQLCYNPLRLGEITEKPPRPPAENTPCEPSSVAEVLERRASEPARVSTDSAQEIQVEFPANVEATLPPADAVTDNVPITRTQSPEKEDSEITEAPESRIEDVKNRNPTAEIRRRYWVNRVSRSPISKRLETCQYLFQAPNHYIFHGAEVYSNSEDETSSSCGSDTNGSCCSVDGLGEEDSDAEDTGTLPVDDGEDKEDCLTDTLLQRGGSEDEDKTVHTDNASETVQSPTRV
ncbi:NAD-dependent protein deacetylase sirtuin-1 isoform X2 [Scleropages formosus]|uniref:NAD-dependent protein deacetylase sirtuin-1 isoform X2 n=1 Tax=Scleropages formosus TaxID=113540 RepID=UPI0010FA883E|nr:NAD-dependent protein deacetylase sirtuin-1 isoform X2 [Scleropages formosus]